MNDTYDETETSLRLTDVSSQGKRDQLSLLLSRTLNLLNTNLSINSHRRSSLQDQYMIAAFCHSISKCVSCTAQVFSAERSRQHYLAEGSVAYTKVHVTRGQNAHSCTANSTNLMVRHHFVRVWLDE